MKKLVCLLLCASLFIISCSDNLQSVNQDNSPLLSGSSKDKVTSQQLIIGDLGGVPVEMPSDSVRLVEYDGDPDWGESFKGDIPERTYQSKISSFGFDVRYTDGAIYDGIVGRYADEYEAQKNLADSPWVSVSIKSGSRYHGKGAVHRIAEGTINAGPNRHPTSIYTKLSDNFYGLDVYTSPGINPKTNKPWQEDEYAEDVFIKYDDKDAITTYIKCSNREVEHPPCTHYFDLEPEMGLYVYVSYSRHVLQDWQKIEQAVTEAILGFRK